MLTTADKPVPGNDTFIQLSDGTDTWADASCTATLAATLPPQTVPWAIIAALPRAATSYSCSQLQSMLNPSGARALEVMTTDDKIAGNGVNDGFVRLADGTKTWVSASCRSQLVSAGVPYAQVAWTSIAAIPDTSASPACSAITPASSGALGAPDSQGATLLLTADKAVNQGTATGTDGWLYLPDGSVQWVNASCVSSLTSAGIKNVVTSWSNIAALPTETSPVDCAGVTPAALPLQIMATAPITSAGGTVTSPDGVSLAIPAGAVTSPTTASITTTTVATDDVHINGPWTGTVQVTVPTDPSGDGVLHQIDGIWLPEASYTGQSSITVTVSTLSAFQTLTNLAKKALGKAVSGATNAVLNKVLGPYCLSSLNIRGIVACLAARGVNSVDTGFAQWLARETGDPSLANCNKQLIQTAINALGGSSGKAGAFSIFASAFKGACIGDADSAGAFPVTATMPPPVTTPPSNPTPPNPTPPVTSPPPTPAPSGASITATKGGYYKGGYQLAVAVHNFPTGRFSYSCYDQGGNFYSNSVSVTNPNQSSWPGVFCYDSAPYAAWIVINGVSSNHVQF